MIDNAPLLPWEIGQKATFYGGVNKSGLENRVLGCKETQQMKGDNLLTCLQQMLKMTAIHLLVPLGLGQQVVEGRSKLDC
ncbi:hypothetical protein TNCV_3458261 [Trichonephila clavipes]|nr:hypothetical protein TNCV_3458261 [Trichonephila clavipes]